MGLSLSDRGDANRDSLCILLEKYREERPMLQNQKALVTGSSRGIGLAIAEAYLKHGAQVCLHSQLSIADCPEVQAVLNEYRERACYIQADLTQEGEAERLVEQAWNGFDGIDVLVNNVGTFREPSYLKLSKSDFDFIFNVNVWSAIAMSQAVVKRAVEAQRGGRILFTTSLNGSRSEPGHTLYDASKGAIDALTRQLAIELAPLGFTTAAVAPGLVETPLTDFGLRSDPSVRQAIIEQIPIRRIATVDDIAGWFVFLASPAARYATGIIIPVDGGLDAQQMSLRPLAQSETA